jgi:hypothetical protein
MERSLASRTWKKVSEFGRRKAPALVMIGAVSLAGAGCGGIGSGGEIGEQPTSPDPPAASQGPFQVTEKFDLPPKVQLSPQPMTAQKCEDDFWTDDDGKRQPAVQKDPLIVRVDGRCNTPLSSDKNGVYATPEQAGRAPIVVVNGEALGVVCVEEDGQLIQDLRGPRSSSTVWLGVVTARGEVGYFPEVNAGYVDEDQLIKDGIVRDGC